MWSLGLTLFFAATGSFPFGGRSSGYWELLFAMERAAVPHLPAGFSPQFDSFVQQWWAWLSSLRRSMQKDPHMRPSLAQLRQHPFLALHRHVDLAAELAKALKALKEEKALEEVTVETAMGRRIGSTPVSLQSPPRASVRKLVRSLASPMARPFVTAGDELSEAVVTHTPRPTRRLSIRVDDAPPLPPRTSLISPPLEAASPFSMESLSPLITDSVFSFSSRGSSVCSSLHSSLHTSICSSFHNEASQEKGKGELLGMSGSLLGMSDSLPERSDASGVEDDGSRLKMDDPLFVMGKTSSLHDLERKMREKQ